MKLHNTLTKNKDTFTTLVDGKVSMYVCGPTVYDRPHIGNARSVVVYDTLYRLLINKYGAENVTYVRNITDVDDKINARATELGISIQELTSRTYSEFQEDMAYLGCLSPKHEPKATEHIKGIIELNERLIASGNAYVSDGHVYFDVTSAADYGLLSGRTLSDMIAGARVEVNENKRHPGDFVLWKPASAKDDISSVFESPWGAGRPGWHIECSAMSYHFLGTDFDIHGGGADLIFPHHTNEIAQSSCGFPGSKFARFWVHNGFLTVNGEKMSKSLGNFFTVYDLMQKGVKGEVIRYLLLSTHYRKPLDFNDKALYDAGESLDYLYRTLESAESSGAQSSGAASSSEGFSLSLSSKQSDQLTENLPKEFLEFLEDDINTPAALHFMHNLAKQINKAADKVELSLSLLACGRMIGILQQENWFASEAKDIDISLVEELVSKRIDAKKTRNFDEADKIREELRNMGVEIEDKPDGASVWRKFK